jgi:murein L,D-transpeptidase YcbB/YkuD
MEENVLVLRQFGTGASSHWTSAAPCTSFCPLSMRPVTAFLRAIALTASLAAVACFGAPPRAGPARAGPPRAAAAHAPFSAAPIELSPEIVSFYRERDLQPLWVERRALSADAEILVQALPPDPELAAAVRAARTGDPRALARADLLLTRDFVDEVRERRRPPERGAMRYIDEGLAPEPASERDTLYALAAAPSLADHVRSALRRNPAYDGLQRGLAAYRARWSRLPQVQVSAGRPDSLRQRLGARDPAAGLREFQGVHGLPVTGRADRATVAALNRGAAYYERRILANIERARAIPAAPGRRYVLVDTASARLFMIEDGRIQGSMRVIVGKRDMPTPEMAGLIRYAALNPYWNLPPDLIRQRARNAVRQGPGAITAERLQVLSDWTPDARILQPRQVNWAAVAAGRTLVNMRQMPGPQNMMGRVKYMLPNELGVYLHDTPRRDLFAGADRRQSSGCVRLEDAGRLGRWLFRGPMPRATGAAEQRADLPEPIPVYITYLTALPTADGKVVFLADSYNRDPRAASAPRRAARATRATPAASRARRGRAAAARPARRP